MATVITRAMEFVSAPSSAIEVTDIQIMDNSGTYRSLKGATITIGGVAKVFNVGSYAKISGTWYKLKNAAVNPILFSYRGSSTNAVVNYYMDDFDTLYAATYNGTAGEVSTQDAYVEYSTSTRQIYSNCIGTICQDNKNLGIFVVAYNVDSTIYTHVGSVNFGNGTWNMTKYTGLQNYTFTNTSPVMVLIGDSQNAAKIIQCNLNSAPSISTSYTTTTVLGAKSSHIRVEGNYYSCRAIGSIGSYSSNSSNVISRTANKAGAFNCITAWKRTMGIQQYNTPQQMSYCSSFSDTSPRVNTSYELRLSNIATNTSDNYTSNVRVLNATSGGTGPFASYITESGSTYSIGSSIVNTKSFQCTDLGLVCYDMSESKWILIGLNSTASSLNKTSLSRFPAGVYPIFS